MSDLERTMDKLYDWFCCNNFKVIPSLFISPFNLKFMNIKSYSIKGRSSEKFLSVTLDSNLTFEKHSDELCK